jgi:hypothetical protein
VSGINITISTQHIRHQVSPHIAHWLLSSVIHSSIYIPHDSHQTLVMSFERFTLLPRELQEYIATMLPFEDFCSFIRTSHEYTIDTIPLARIMTFRQFRRLHAWGYRFNTDIIPQGRIFHKLGLINIHVVNRDTKIVCTIRKTAPPSILVHSVAIHRNLPPKIFKIDDESVAKAKSLDHCDIERLGVIRISGNGHLV